MKNDEYKGGFYVLFEFVGLYVRLLFCKIFKISKSKEELSGEKNYPVIDTKERFKCLIIGIVAVCATLSLVLLLIYD